MIDELLKDARERMAKSVETINHEFASVRTGRASPALLDRIVVDYYGAATPLNQLATISAPEARLLSLQPYDKSSIKMIEKAILESDVGLTPGNDGSVIRLTVPELTEERRKQTSRSCTRSPKRAGSRSATCAAMSCTTCASSRARAKWAPTTSTGPRSSCRS